MQQGFYSISNTIDQYLVDWSLSGLMTSKHVIRKSESPRPAASSILISRMTSSSVIIPYIIPFSDETNSSIIDYYSGVIFTCLDIISRC